MSGYVKPILTIVGAVNAVAAFEFFQLDAPFLAAFGLSTKQLTPGVLWLCSSLASLHAALAVLLVASALLLEPSARRTVGWAACGAHLLLAENVLRLREVVHADASLVEDATLLRCGSATVVHVICAMALVAVVIIDMANDKNLARPPASEADDDVDDPLIPMVPHPDANNKDQANKNKDADDDAAPGFKPGAKVDWRTFKATPPATSAASSSSSSPGAKNQKPEEKKKK